MWLVASCHELKRFPRRSASSMMEQLQRRSEAVAEIREKCYGKRAGIPRVLHRNWQEEHGTDSVLVCGAEDPSDIYLINVLRSAKIGRICDSRVAEQPRR